VFQIDVAVLRAGAARAERRYRTQRARRALEEGLDMDEAQRTRMARGPGFVAALDQSGGSTPQALRQYGVRDSDYADDDRMFDLMHEFRSRIITSPAFDGDRVLAAILFDQTMQRHITGVPVAEYLWWRKNVVPFVKVDEGLLDPSGGVRLMKPFTRLDEILRRAADQHVFGTKMRSVITQADPDGIDAVVDQQFAYALQILDAGLVPIVEPEVDVTSAGKVTAEKLLKAAIQRRLAIMPSGQQIMLKLSIPTIDGFYADLMAHPNVLRVVALSGGYDREDAVTRLARNPGLIASFSRALTEGLHRDQTDEEFNRTLDAAISAIYAASAT
jgi:fructose-bisphosphate aldolase class I